MNPCFKTLVDTVSNPETRHLYGIKSVSYDDQFAKGLNPDPLIRCIITFDNGFKVVGYDSGSPVYERETATFKMARKPSRIIALTNTVDAARLLFEYLQRQVEMDALEKVVL